jgi:DNA-binding response OmpR family regulator
MEVRRHRARAEQEGDGMHTHADQPSAPPLAESTTTLLAGERRLSDAPTVAREQQSETIWHNLDGLVLQRNDAHRMLIIAGRWIQLSPTQYALLVPLLEHFGHPVSHAEIYWRAFGASYSPRDARRTYYHIDKLRPRLGPFGLMIRTVIDHGYMLLREAQEP